jgi:thiol-disulfide isomerase/thioredoxin
MAQQKGGTVSLRGTLVNFPSRVEIEDFSEFQYIKQQPKDRIIEADKDNHFTISFKIEKPGYFRIGRNAIYLTPGDDMEVVIDRNEYLTSTFKGKGGEVNMYMRNTPFPKSGSYIQGARNLKPSVKETMDLVHSLSAEREKELKALKSASKEFVVLETARQKADIIRSYQAIRSYSGSMLSRRTEAERKSFLDSLDTYVKPETDKLLKGFVDTTYLQILVYRDLFNYLKLDEEKVRVADVKQIRDWHNANAMAYKIRGESDKGKLTNYRSYIDTIHAKQYRDLLNIVVNEKMKFGIGDVAIDFAVRKTDGTETRLSSLKGKVIYIDVWATWCGPCMAEMPKLEELKQVYASKEDLAIVSLSVDDTDKIWLKNLDQRKPGGIQWRIDRIGLSDYEVESIPRYILIDKAFKVIDLNAPQPSAKEIQAIIDGLLSKS